MCEQSFSSPEVANGKKLSEELSSLMGKLNKLNRSSRDVFPTTAGDYKVSHLSGNDQFFDDSEARKSAWKSGLEQFAATLTATKAAFGFGSSEIFDELVISRDKQIDGNAGVKGLVRTTSGTLDAGPKIIDFVARHECVHAVDMHLGFRLSGGAFGQAFSEIERVGTTSANPPFANIDKEDLRGVDFFHQLNENAFCGAAGGQSQLNAQEALASFVNSLYCESWSEKIKELPAEFKRHYILLCKGLEQNIASLEKDGTIPKRTTISTILKKRIDEIQA